MQFNALGVVVLTQALRPMTDTVYLSGLANGLYFYSIKSGGLLVGSSKVVSGSSVDRITSASGRKGAAKPRTERSEGMSVQRTR